ncbi:mobilization protein [Escherichia coli TA206]|uniref:MobC family replication-relaxation protein n=1 Tax=Escherichia coli TaxID=562 RepID=UPI000209CD0B|nr:MobC family replication-relaxation protein [Escherichia coli]EGI25737.1 mobilization protein [Escherichia coli TA206]
MLISDTTERNKIATKKMSTLLHFLKEETYSDFNTLRRVLGFSKSAHSPVYRILSRAIKKGFIIKHEIPGVKQKITIWGITMQGLAMVVMPDDAVFPGYFEPGKLRYWTLEHRLLNQRVRIALEQKGGQGWLNGDRGEFIARYPGVRHRPDGIITLDSGAIVAVETERSMKTRARYISIINSHLAASDAGRWHYAMYVMPDDKTKTSLIRLFDSIKTVMRNNVPVSFDAKHREMFLFRTIDELEQTTARSSQ